MKEEKIKEIISIYTKIPTDQIDAKTKIDRSAVSSSILLHRMYADLAKLGCKVTGYLDIKDFGILLSRLNTDDLLESNNDVAISISTPIDTTIRQLNYFNPIGIDIEETGSLPFAKDFREDKFYSMYFSPSEISYCILQTDPVVSFTGLFAAKEAIVKADNTYKNLLLNTIVIDHLASGKPVHPDFYLSITHTANLAVAVAIKKNILTTSSPSATGSGFLTVTANTTLIYFVSFSAIILAFITFIIVIFRG